MDGAPAGRPPDAVEAPLMGCEHYKRKCKLVAPCCGEVAWCRHCHQEETGHHLDRTQIREMVCMLCHSRQPCAQSCMSCGEELATYYCDHCHFWDDEGSAKQVFHCVDCGICRVGGRENYFHCSTCASCYPHAIRDSHTCVPNAMRTDCPVCREDLFQSTEEVSVLMCGHTIHGACLHQLLRSGGLQSVRCPLCAQSLCKGTHAVWREIDRTIERTPMPEDCRFEVEVCCNDCHETSVVPHHVIGHKCAHCQSYNTHRK